MFFAKASQIVQYVKKAAAEGWGYVLGANGEPYNEPKAQLWAKTRNKPSSWVGTKFAYFVTACARWFGKMVADCSGLIVGAIRAISPSYGDRSANTFKAQFVESGTVKTIPEIPGLAVWKSGHIGIYIGNGQVVEARGYKYGVVITKLSSRPWTHWGKIKDVEYDTVTVDKPALIVSKYLKYHRGKQCDAQVIALQERLRELGYYAGKIDGWFGSGTRGAVEDFQSDAHIEVDGVVGRETTEALGGTWQGK